MSDTDELKNKGHPSVHHHTHVDINASAGIAEQGIQGARVGKTVRSSDPMLTSIQGPKGIQRVSD